MLVHAFWTLLAGLSTALPSMMMGVFDGSTQNDLVNLSAAPGETSSFIISAFSNLSRRWDGSPAMGQEYAKARSKGCTLWSMMNSDDADAGQMFTPPRASAHSDYLQLEGMMFLPSSALD